MVYFSDPDSHDDLSHDNDDRANEEMLALAPRLQVNPSDLQVGPVITKKDHLLTLQSLDLNAFSPLRKGQFCPNQPHSPTLAQVQQRDMAGHCRPG